MPNDNFHPSINEIISIDNIPDSFHSVEDLLDNLLEKIYYTRYFRSSNIYGDFKKYSINLFSYERLAWNIPGTELNLVVNSAVVDGENVTQVPLELTYQLKAIRLKKLFQNFSGEPSSHLELFFKSLGVSYAKFIESSIANLTSTKEISELITTLNSEYPALSFNNDGLLDPSNAFNDLALQMQVQGLNILNTIFELFIANLSIGDAIDKIVELFKYWIHFENIEDIIKDFFIPKISFYIGTLSLGLEFPEHIFKPVDENIPTTILNFNAGSVGFSSHEGFDFNEVGDISFTKSYILGTGFYLEINGMKLDLSKNKNLPEANADGRPNDFIGAYITEGSIGFPADWNHDPEDEGNTAELFVNNLLVGTGGISGTIGMRATNPEADPEIVPPLIKARFGENFTIALKGFDLTFQQNAIISSNIHGTLQIPGFQHPDGSPAEIDIEIHIGQDGEFNIVVSSDQPLKTIKVPNAFTFDIDSLFFGRETGDDGRFYIGISGLLDFTINGEVGKYLPDKINIEKMLIYDDGKFEFEGGKLTLPKAISLSFGPAKVSITGIHMGSYEKEGRKYKFFGFDGGVKVNPGGVEAHGKGIKYYYTVDDGSFKFFIGLESLSVDIIIPSGADPAKAAVAIRGFLSISEPKFPPPPDPDPNPGLTEVLQNSQEYIGSVSVSIPKFKGLQGSAAMRLNPKVPAFIIDIGIELSTPIVLGSTGLGIYGFRGLLGKKYVATKFAAGVPEDGEWWQYYKAKIDPDYRPGIQVSKFSTKNGFSFGAGVSLATASDSGKIFSSKLFFLLSLPDVFLFQGQAQFLKERIGLDANPDPPFFAIIAITNKSIEAGFGVNYKLRDEGKIVTVDGIIELGFFWGDSSAWYINVGRETPDDRRIQARLFDILNMYFYLMLSNGGIRLGAGVLFEKKKTFGPLSAELKAYIDTFGKISRRPKQIGGALKMGGTVSLKICGFGFGVSGSATLAGEAPKPHIVTGEFEVCITVLKKERCARFELTWSKDDEVDVTRVPLLVGTVGESTDLDTADVNKVAGSSHMVSGERFAIASTVLGGSDAIPNPAAWIVNTDLDDYRVPMDSFIDIEFKKGMNVSPGTNNLGKFGGQSGPAKYVEFVPPIRGKSDRVRHEYYLKDVEIFYWKEDNDGDHDGAGVWEAYDFYEALLPIYQNAPGVLPNAIADETLANMKWGYWQQQQPGVNNKLRILATSPLSYTSSTGDAFNIEDMGINSSTIFCPGDEIPLTCITFDVADLYTTYLKDTIRTYENVNFRIVGGDGVVLDVPYEGLANGLMIPFGCKLEVFFNEPMKRANLSLSSAAAHIVVKYYRRETNTVTTGGVTSYETTYGLTSYDYTLVETQTFDGDYNEMLYLCADAGGIDYITIEPNTCSLTGMITANVNNQATILADIKRFLEKLIHYNHLTASTVEIKPSHQTDYAPFLESTLYGKDGHIVNLTQTHFSPTSLTFRITDDLGFDCLWNLDLKSEVSKFDFSTIIGVKSVVMYTADDTLGANSNFLVTFDLQGAGTVDFIGSTCKTLSYSYDRCATGFYELCYLSLEDFLANESILVDEQGDNNTALIDSINKTLQPVWRPNTTFAIQVKTEDRLYQEGGGSYVHAPYAERVVYGFRTAGPIGHFHQYPALSGAAETVKERKDYEVLANVGKENEFRLSNLRSYIDYTKSYPNADSQLINAKPLFYINAELRLFYLYNYVYQFYTDWVDYAHSVEGDIVKLAESSLDVVILNPAPSVTPEETLSEGFQLNSIVRNAVLGQPPGLINEVNHEVSILNNLLINGNPCAPYTPMTPIDLSTRKVMNLKPNKLYTAQFIAKYKPAFDGTLTTEEFQSIVHSYVFQTSRYSSFQEQVNSYILKTNTEEEVLLAAVYPLALTKDFDPGLAQKVIENNLGLQEDALRTQYADRFEQLVNGVFAIDLNTLQAAVRTEFNLVHRNGQLVGILIRNPEPFNDPKIPAAPYSASSTDPLESLVVYRRVGGSWTNENDYVAIHSKDKSQIFVTLRSFTFDFNLASELKFEFKYKQYNGVTYGNVDVAKVNLDLTNYPI